MSIEKHMSLNAAAKLAGVDHHTMKRWIELDLGVQFPRVRHGAKLLVREKDVEYVLARRRDVRNTMRRGAKDPR